jgi:hypothetical protein
MTLAWQLLGGIKSAVGGWEIAYIFIAGKTFDTGR